MNKRELVIGGKYRHFKDKYYRVLCVALHSETMEKLVIYQAQYGENAVYARPYDMFFEPVDQEKYPHADQKYRFEYIAE